MTYDWLLWLYGLTTIAALCNTPTWWVLTYEAARDNLHTRYLIARLAIAVFNIGVLISVWIRASEAAALINEKVNAIPLIDGFTKNLQYTFWDNHPAMFRAISTGFLLTGEVLMLSASAFALKVSGKRALAWRAFVGLGIVWTIVHWSTPL